MSIAVPVRFGILSTARINAKLIAGVRASALAEIVAVASRSPSRARAYARARDIEHAHGSYDALLADDDVEAVYVSLPNRGHVEWSMRAVAAGKHVLVEKPLTRRPHEAERLFDAADAAGVHVMEAFMYRHHPQTLRLCELVADGAIGRLQLVRGCFTIGVDDQADPRWLASEDGGALMDVGVYPLSAARMLAGEPERVYAERVEGGSGVDARLVAVLRHADGVISHLDCGLGDALRHRLEVAGNDGTLVLADPWIADEPAIELWRGSACEHIGCERADAYRLEVENLAAAIRGQGAPLLARADAVSQARAVAALYESAETGRPVRLDGA